MLPRVVEEILQVIRRDSRCGNVGKDVRPLAEVNEPSEMLPSFPECAITAACLQPVEKLIH